VELNIKNTLVLITALFFMVTYFFSSFEKLVDWKNTISYYKNHFKDTFISFWVPSALGGIVIFEIIVVLGLGWGVYQFIREGTITILYFSYLISAFLLMTFLIGQRIARDYQGATSITIYLIFNILAFYFLN